MVFDPERVAKGFLGGVAAGQQQQVRGLDIERMRKEMRAKEAQERKREQISGLLGQFVGGEGDRQQITGQLVGLGRPGVEALQAGEGLLGQRQQQQLQQDTTTQKAAGQKLVNALPYAMNVTDEQEWRTQAFPYIADAFVQSGGDPELVRRLNTMPMDQAKQVMQQMFQEAQAKTPTGDYKTYQDTETGQTITLNEADPRDQQYLRENRENLIPAPSREEVGKPGEFAVTKKQGEELKESEIATKQAIAGANDLLAKLTETPDLLQTATGIAQFASGVGSEIRSAARAAGVDIPEEITDIAAYEDTFAELGIKNKVAKGLAFDLALSYAAASGLGTGRALTDRDIRLAMQRIGAGGMDTPAARKAAIQDVQRVLERNFKIRYESLTGKPYPGELGLKAPKPAKGGLEVPEMVGGQSTVDMPEGSEIRGAGVTYVKRGGIWQKK